MPGQAPNSGDSAWLAPDRQGLAGQFLRLDPALTVLATGRADNVFLCHPFLMHAGVHSRGAQIWRQPMAGSGGSQGFPAMALLMASSAVTPWAAAESRKLRRRHHRASVARECQYPETA